MPQKLFILIRKDLTVAQQGVQAGHAVAQWCKRWMYHGNQEWNNQILVYVTVDDHEHLQLWARKIMQHGLDLNTVTFNEPDMPWVTRCTTLVCFTDSNLFDKLPLWEPATDWVAASM